MIYVLFICFWTEMATVARSSAESEALIVAFDYLVNGMDTAALLSKALSSRLISELLRSECASEPDPYKQAEKFLSHLRRAVNGDSNKYHTFVQILYETGQASIASHLQGMHGHLPTYMVIIVTTLIYTPHICICVYMY